MGRRPAGPAPDVAVFLPRAAAGLGGTRQGGAEKGQAAGDPSGDGSKLSHQGTAGFGPCSYLPKFHLGYVLLTHTQVKIPCSLLEPKKRTHWQRNLFLGGDPWYKGRGVSWWFDWFKKRSQVQSICLWSIWEGHGGLARLPTKTRDSLSFPRPVQQASIVDRGSRPKVILRIAGHQTCGTVTSQVERPPAPFKRILPALSTLHALTSQQWLIPQMSF